MVFILQQILIFNAQTAHKKLAKHKKQNTKVVIKLIKTQKTAASSHGIQPVRKSQQNTTCTIFLTAKIATQFITHIKHASNPAKKIETYDSPASARSSALSKSASTMANLRATCHKQRHFTKVKNKTNRQTIAAETNLASGVCCM